MAWMRAGKYGAMYREGEGVREDEAFWSTLSERIEANRQGLDVKHEEVAQAYEWWAAHGEKNGDEDKVTRTKAKVRQMLYDRGERHRRSDGRMLGGKKRQNMSIRGNARIRPNPLFKQSQGDKKN